MSKESDPVPEKPPLFKSWKALYTVVLLFHAIVISIFIMITIWYK